MNELASKVEKVNTVPIGSNRFGVGSLVYILHTVAFTSKCSGCVVGDKLTRMSADALEQHLTGVAGAAAAPAAAHI